MPSPEHQRAQEFAASAELTKARGDSEAARSLYAKAANLELEGFRRLSQNEPRSRGILAVSYASLLFKAGLYDRAEVAICSLLADPGILPGFRDELRELLQATWEERLLESEQAETREETIAGTLRAVHLDQHWIRIVPEEGQPVEVITASEDLGDVIGPMVNRKVVVRISRGGRSERSRPKLLDLELLED